MYTEGNEERYVGILVKGDVLALTKRNLVYNLTRIDNALIRLARDIC